MKLLGVILFLLSIDVFAKADYILTCDYIGKDEEPLKLILVLHKEDGVFELIRDDHSRPGVLIVKDNFYKMQITPEDNLNKPKILITVNRITSNFTLKAVRDYREVGKVQEIKGKCAKQEYKQSL